MDSQVDRQEGKPTDRQAELALFLLSKNTKNHSPHFDISKSPYNGPWRRNQTDFAMYYRKCFI